MYSERHICFSLVAQVLDSRKTLAESSSVDHLEHQKHIKPLQMQCGCFVLWSNRNTLKWNLHVTFVLHVWGYFSAENLCVCNTVWRPEQWPNWMWTYKASLTQTYKKTDRHDPLCVVCVSQLLSLPDGFVPWRAGHAVTVKQWPRQHRHMESIVNTCLRLKWCDVYRMHRSIHKCMHTTHRHKHHLISLLCHTDLLSFYSSLLRLESLISQKCF